MRIRHAVLTTLFAAACASAPPPAPEGPKVTSETKLQEVDQSLTGFVATASVKLVNEGEAPVQLKGAQYELVQAGQVLKKGRVPLEGEIGPGEELEVEVPAQWEYAESREQLVALTERKEPLAYALRGVVELTNGSVEFARAGAVRSPKMLTVKLDTIEAVNSPTRGLTVNALIDVGNPNPFAVPIKALNWKVALAGQPTAEGVLARNDVAKPASQTRYELTF
ncbi:MAG: LEA type 2 family protein, partial [Myxococcales bacterium]